MKKSKKLISLLLALTMLLSMIPMAMAAETTVNLGRTKLDDAILEKGTPSSFSHLRDMKDGSAAKGVGETGFWQRLPRNTVVGYGTVTPVNYAVPKEGSVTVSNEGVIGDFSFSLEPWAGNEFTTNPPCLQFNYTALAVGSTTVTVKYYYNYGLINIQGGRTWYEETATFTINVNDGDINKPSKPTVDDVKRFRNYVNTTSSSLGAVYMWCDTYDHQAWFDYITEVDDAYTLGDVVANDGSVLSKYTYPWVCVMTLDANKYLDAYNYEFDDEWGTHYLKDGQAATETATWYWNADLSKWQFRSSEAPIYIDITHDKPVTEETYVLHYDANGGEGAPASQTTKSNTGKATFTVSSAIPTRDGCTFLGWADDADATAVQYHGGDEITLTKDNPTKTIYAVWEAKNPQPPLIPAPSYDDLKSAIGQIQVKDVSTPSCGTENYDLIDNTQSEPFNWTKTARLDQPGKYDVTIKTAPYVAKYNSEKTKTHELNNANQTTLKLVISYENNKWVLDDGLRVIEVKHSEQNPPTDIPNPNPGNIAENLKVKVVCTTPNSGHEPAFYSLIDGTFTHTDVDQSGDYPTCSITISPDEYISQYSTDKNCQHTTPDDPKTVPLFWNKEAQKWAVNDGQIGLNGVVFNAVCEAVPDTFTVTYTDGVDGEEVFADQVYSGLRKDSETPAFNGTPNREGYTFAGWEPEVTETVTQTVTYVAKWEKKTYKVVAKLYVNGKPAYYQNEDFYTYKVSGLYGENIDFDTIKAEAVEQAKQIKKASASYTAVILEDHEPNPVCTTFGEHQPGQATHYVKVNVKTEENVVIFQSFEGKTDLTKLHTTTAPYGTNVVEFLNGLGLDLDVAGYTLDTAEDGNTNWYKKDSPKWTFGANDTINGWTNVLLKYTITPHNIYAFARLNSYVAPLTTSEFDTPVTLNEATLSRLGLGSYNSLGYISIGSFTFDAMPLTSDLYFADDAELSAVAEKLATDIALETGVSDEIAEKIAWTALYKTVNEEDMEPGYPAEAGYQLSGNLNLATVMFKAGGENVTGMPVDNYVYDDVVGLYDFYYTGDTFTLPADPTREGYSFEGWSVEVLSAENDADCYDADGADDAADETLLKAGDTYTITAGGVIFTAQWEKKTFTVKYYLPDETGAWVEKKMDTVDSVDYATYSLWTPNAEDGYEFSGWYQKTADIGVKAKVEKLYMAKEWKLYGKFTPIEYTIQYVYNDGKATSTNPTTYTVESDTITLADATGADWGKTFLEWHDENGQKITEIPTGSTGDRVITAYWNWPVHLHYLDKDNNEIESATLYVSELEPGACVLPTGEKTGYDFDGWYEAKKDIGTASHKLNALSIAKKWELYGRYTAKTDVSYTVKYLREGDNKVLAPEKVVTDQTFDTEVTEQAADVVGYTPDAPSKTMILDEYNKVLTFSYSANTYRYEIHYFLQEPDGSYMEKEVDTTPTGVFDTTVTITPDPNRYGAHYSYNSVKSVVSGVVTVDDPATILKLNVYYDLDFHTLTFDTMGGSAIDPVTVRHGNAVARPADPTKDKYTFIGWYVDPEFTEEYDFATVLEADKTIYAKFELTSTPIGDIYVRYDVLHIKQLPDGSYDLANAEVEHLSAKKDTTVTAVVKDYRATHHINVNSTLSKLTDTAIQPYPGADGKPVYTILSVYYDLDFHTLTFDTMGGSRIDPVTVRHGNAVAKPKDPVNGGYIFDGWYTDKTYRTPYNFATVLTQDTTIYAKWFLIALPGVTIKKATPKLNTSDHFAYVQGYPDGTVKPTGNITRAETAAILFRLMDEGSRKTYYSTKSGFRDVATGSWYNTYVATLNNAGVITDSSNGYFRPNEAITRAELAAMLANFTETAGAANYFNDVSARYWAANAIAICAKLGWITGYPDGSFRPDRNVTRAELMAMINRATGRAPKSADAFLPGMKTWSDNTADKWYYLDVQEATNSHSYTVKDSEKWTALNADPNWSLYE